MSPDVSIEIVASRLESRIVRSESNNQILIIQAEGRVNTRIHELEMKLIRRGVFAWPEIDTQLKWAVAVWVACILFFLFVGVGSALVERKPGDVQPASQERPAETPAPQVASPQNESE
jgi:hypothetical protein